MKIERLDMGMMMDCTPLTPDGRLSTIITVAKKLNEVIERLNASQEKEEPMMGQEFWYIYMNGSVHSEEWSNRSGQRTVRDFGNCFKTREEAEAAAIRVKELLLSLKG